MLTIRLDKKTEEQLETTSEMLGMSKSEVVRQSLQQFLSNVEKPSAWDLGQDLFGKHSSGIKNLSLSKRAQISDRIRAKKG